MPVESLKSKLDGNQLDLSLSALTTVPVKELQTVPKATRLDLSCNMLTIIDPDFCLLTHLVEIDLSKNQLTELPDSFGNLLKLQRLDLYHNKLTHLPLTFCRLNALKWLDIRDNPLDGGLLVAGGDCLSDAQCRKCAKDVVIYMKKMQSDHERERQKKLQELREKEALQKLEEERELQRKRAEKKAEKERRRQLTAKRVSEDSKAVSEEEVRECMNHAAINGKAGLDLKSRNSGLSYFQLALTLLLLAVAAFCGLYVYCSSATSLNVNDYCTTGMQWINTFIQRTLDLYNSCHNKLNFALG